MYIPSQRNITIIQTIVVLNVMIEKKRKGKNHSNAGRPIRSSFIVRFLSSPMFHLHSSQLQISSLAHKRLVLRPYALPCVLHH